jgi:carboxyl-terminal processing protease
MVGVAQRLRRIFGALALCIAVALITAPPGIPARPREPSTLSQQDRVDIFERAWRDIHDLYYDPAFHGVNWDQIHEQYLPKIRDSKDDEEFYALLRRMTGELHDAHTRFYSPEQWKRIKLHEHAGLGFAAADVEGKIAIAAVDWDSEAFRAGIKPGMIVRTIDGKPIAERVADAAAAREASSSERADRLLALRDAFSAPVGSTVKIGLLRADGSAFEAQVTARIYQNLPQVESRSLPSGEAYIAFDEFSRFSAKAFKRALQASRNAPGVIVDLRGNGGGELDPMITIAGYFLNDKTLIAKYSTRNGKPIAWFGGMVKLKLDVEAGQRGEAIYTGPVTLLVGPRTASASEIFTGGMQEIGRVKVIGTQTCGCVLGITKPREMKGGGVLEISESMWMTPKGRKLEGDGIIPDKIVAPTIADLQQKRDPALAEAEKTFEQKTSEQVHGVSSSSQ